MSTGPTQRAAKRIALRSRARGDASADELDFMASWQAEHHAQLVMISRGIWALAIIAILAALGFSES